jgi:predicted nucleotidyltransferase
MVQTSQLTCICTQYATVAKHQGLHMQEIAPEVLQEIVARLIGGLAPEKIVLFGSHAYGEPHEASDIDLLVVVAEAHESQHKRAAHAYRCLRGLTAPTEVIVLTELEAEQAARVPASLVSQALQHGRVLYE